MSMIVRTDFDQHADDLQAHAERDYPGTGGLDKVQRGVFLARGGHAPGTTCPTEPVPEPDPHAYWCPGAGDCTCDGIGADLEPGGQR